MKKLILLMILIPVSLIGQNWEMKYGQGRGVSAIQTNDNNYVVTGVNWDSDESMSNVFLLKIDINGDTIWSRNYINEKHDRAFSVQQIHDDGYIITCFSKIYNSEDYNLYMIRTDNNGDTIWTKAFGDSLDAMGTSVKQTHDNGFIFTGILNHHLLLLKTDFEGETEWFKTYGEHLCSGQSVLQTDDLGYIVAGRTPDSGETFVYLIRTDKNGDTLWSRTISVDYYNSGNSIIKTTDDGYVICGTTKKFNSDNDALLLKIDESGNLLWIRRYGGDSDDAGYSVWQTTDGGYVICGTRNVNSYSSLTYLIRTDSEGLKLWDKTYGGDDASQGNSIQETKDGGFIISGTYFKNGTDESVYVIKTDSYGDVLSITEFPYVNPDRKLVKIIDLSGREVPAPLKHLPYIEIYDDGTTQKKIKLK